MCCDIWREINKQTNISTTLYLIYTVTGLTITILYGKANIDNKHISCKSKVDNNSAIDIYLL